MAVSLTKVSEYVKGEDLGEAINRVLQANLKADVPYEIAQPMIFQEDRGGTFMYLLLYNLPVDDRRLVTPATQLPN